jgi:hypothetical protein
MLLSQFGGSHVLEVFAIPSILEYGKESMAKAGVPDAFVQEVLDSYAILFNPKNNFDPHGPWVGWLRRPWCWCISCSSRRLRKAEFARLADYNTTSTELLIARLHDKSEYDPFLKVAMSRPSRDWSPRIFPTLWPRIVAAESYLREAKPWNFWVLFRDRRDSLPFWTFLYVFSSLAKKYH